MNTIPLEKTEITNNKPYIAGFWRRLTAFIVDILIAGFFCYIIASLLGSWVYKAPIIMSLIGYLLVTTYFGIFNSKINKGQSFGKMLMSIQVVDQNQQYMNLPVSLLRAAILYAPFCLMSWIVSAHSTLSFLSSVILSSLFFAQIYLFLFNRSNRRCIHDSIAHTYVINDEVEHCDIKPTWSLHFYVAGILAFIMAGLITYETLTTDKSYIPKTLSTFNFKGDQEFDFGYIQYPLENGQTFTKNYFYIITNYPERLNNPHHAEELAEYFHRQEPSLFTSNQQNYIVLTARYQFGLVSLKQSSSYFIQQESYHLGVIEQNHQKGFMISGGF
ncbi:MAG: RDD family protein [Acinetobacter sp.]|nr:RDD family protein [Acinetobacter sp.]